MASSVFLGLSFTSSVGIGTSPLSSTGLIISRAGVLSMFAATDAAGTTWMQVFKGNNGTVTGGLDARGNFHTNLALFVSGGWSMTLNTDGSVASVTTANTGLSDMIDVVGDTTFGIVSKGSATPGHLFTGLDQNANFVFNVDPTGNLQFGAGATIGSVDVNISRLSASNLAIGNGTAGDFTGTVKTGTVNAVTAFQANGTAGVGTFGPSAVTSITVKNGIITAIS